MENYPRLSTRDKDLRYVTPAEYDQILRYLEENPSFKKDRTILLFKLLWHTGARISEVLAITPKDIDLRNRIITITVLKKNAIFKYMRSNLSLQDVHKYRIQTYTKLTPEQTEKLSNNETINLTNSQVYEWHSKLPSVLNQIPIDTTLANELELYILRHNLEKSEKLINLSRTQAWKIVSDFTEKILGKKFHPHSFRHGFAMNLLDKNVPAPVIQSLLKHSSLNTTFNTYAVPTLEMKRKALENR